MKTTRPGEKDPNQREAVFLKSVWLEDKVDRVVDNGCGESVCKSPGHGL